MAVHGLTLKQSMIKAVQTIMPQEEDKSNFEKELIKFLQNLRLKPNESEEFQKNLLKDFLQSCLPENFINTIGRTDLAIYNGLKPDSNVGILIESKSLNNRNEMVSKSNYNVKSFQEVIHYYLNERLVNQNIEIKKCIITNGLEWFVIDSKEIEKHFVNDKKFVDLYNKWRFGQLASRKTDFLYKEVMSPAISKALENGIKLARFDLRDAIESDEKLIIRKSNLTQLYRFFTPENLLNKEIFTDSNKLNKGFYDELLYIMGLEEKKVDNKKVIQRLPEKERQGGSFVENIIERLQMNDILQGKQYEIAIQLTVVWINRILFLKLLESQLITFNSNEKLKFLTKKLLPTFDDIYYLFFGVLAKKMQNRSDEMNEKFPHIPYLNSSLFEETELERSYEGISIDRLRDKKIKYYSRTILKDNNQKKKVGQIEFLSYLFSFLDAYDFSTTISHTGKKNNSNLINASVLGLIFEKINGYKEGSYYTPSHITMYMSKKAIRKAVVEKINEVKGWDCNNIYDVQFKINSLEVAKEINNVIDTLKICDPAVGSGHFLVSVLNELIAIKSELKVLIDSNGRSMNDIRCTVVNDELIIQDFNGDNFIYKRGNKDSERIQKTIFDEKRKLIEGCLFGVDINPNSVNICRLRLWIELLKNSYYFYEVDSKTEQLITLPNIDINIKVGNSLLHKFDIHDSLDKRFSELQNYTQLVGEYKQVNNKLKKQELTIQIEEIKQKFLSSILTPELKNVQRLRNKLMKAGQVDFFASEIEKKNQEQQFVMINKKLQKAMKNLENSRRNPLFTKGLEWRMEFPEVLDSNGDFIGFDVVIANPPYIYSSDNFFSDSEKRYFEKEYSLSRYQANTYGLFLELSLKILRKNGYCSMIIPNTFLTVDQYHVLRKNILEKTGDVFILNSLDKIFDDANVDNCIVGFKNSLPTSVKLAELNNKEVNLINEVSPKDLLKYNIINFSAFKSNKNSITSSNIIDVIDKNSKVLEPNYAIVRDGLKVYQKGKGEPKQVSDDNEFKKFRATNTWFSNYKKNNNYWSIIKGKHIERYKISESEDYIEYGRHLAEPRNEEMFMGERLLIRQIPRKTNYSLTVTYTDKPIMHERSLIAIRNFKIEPFFILGILNSKIESYYAIHKYDFIQRKLFPQLRLHQIKNLPIPNATQEERDILTNLVERKIFLHSLVNPTEENISEIDELDMEIDEYVMNLFKLNEEEKQLIRDFNL